MDLLEALNSYGVPYRPHGSDPNEIWICCPFCEEQGETPDTRFRLGVNVANGNAHCFNCDWGSRDEDFTFSQLSAKLELGELQAAAQKVKPKKKVKVVLPDDFRKITHKSKYSDDYWERRAYQYLDRRGISHRQMEEKEIGFSMVGDYAYRVIIPVYYKDRLRGLVARDFAGKSRLKYKNSVGDKIIFNLPDPRHAEKGIVLVEGPFDTLAVERGASRLRLDAGGLLGHALTIGQEKLLKPYKVVYLWMDPDKAGIEGVVKIAKQLQGKKKVRVVVPDMSEGAENYEPAEQFPQEIVTALSNAKPYTEELGLRLRNWVSALE